MVPTRREFLVGSSVLLAGCRVAPGPPGAPRAELGALDGVLAAHAGVLPEKAGAGANHDPMAAEALEALGRADAIPSGWIRRARSYAGPIPREAPIAEWADALGRYERLGDWLELFEQELERQAWPSVVARWAPRLAPGLSGALFHGLLRTAHAVRALRRGESEARRRELACGLAYWAARATPLPVRAGERRPRIALAELDTPWASDPSDVDFDAVMQRLQAHPLAPEPVPLEPSFAAEEHLASLVREASEAFLEMLAQGRPSIWLLHTITGPAAVGLLLPELDAADSALLVAYAQQALVAVFRAYGAPFVPRASLGGEAPDWPELLDRAVALESVHSIKLFEALLRYEVPGDPLHRTVAVRWLTS